MDIKIKPTLVMNVTKIENGVITTKKEGGEIENTKTKPNKTD